MAVLPMGVQAFERSGITSFPRVHSSWGIWAMEGTTRRTTGEVLAVLVITAVERVAARVAVCIAERQLAQRPPWAKPTVFQTRVRQALEHLPLLGCRWPVAPGAVDMEGVAVAVVAATPGTEAVEAVVRQQSSSLLLEPSSSRPAVAVEPVRPGEWSIGAALPAPQAGMVVVAEVAVAVERRLPPKCRAATPSEGQGVVAVVVVEMEQAVPRARPGKTALLTVLAKEDQPAGPVDQAALATVVGAVGAVGMEQTG